MYEYLIGTSVLGGSVWALIFIARKDLRCAMLWSAGLYVVFLSVAFIPLYLLNIESSFRINPGYWSPPTLFDLNKLTGGHSIEDAIFMFFIAGIATAIYETFTSRRIMHKPDKRLKRNYLLPFIAGVVGGLGSCLLLGLNLMHGLILFNIIGGLTVLYYRRDLARHALLSGLLLLVIYGTLFGIFNLMFPWFVADYYNLEHMTKIIINGTPLEEYLYALTFGFFWGPLYEYEHRVSDRRVTRKAKAKARLQKKVAV